MVNKQEENKKENGMLPWYSKNSHLQRPFTVHSYLTQSNIVITNNAILNEQKSKISYNKPPTVLRRISNSVTKNLKWFTLSIFLVMLTVIIVFIVVVASKDSNNDLCLSQSCLETADRSLKYLDSTVDPCNDFYSFACGNFLKEAKLTNNVDEKDSITSIFKIVSKKLENLINGNVSNNSTKTQPELKKIFDLCMSYRSNSTREIENIKSILNSLGGWPMVMKWNESNFDLKEFILRLKKLGIFYHYLFYYTIEVNPLKTSDYIIRVNTKNPTTIDNKTYKSIINFALKLGANQSIIDADMYKNLQLCNLLIKNYELEDTNNHRYFVLKDISNFTGFTWSVFLNRLIDDPNIIITEEELIVGSRSQRFLYIIKYFLEIPKRIQANYLFIEILLWMYKYLPGLQHLFEAKVPKTKECVNAVTKSLPLMINSLYVKNYFDVESKTKIEKIVYDIRHEFIKIIKTLEWLDDSTREKAIVKLNAMKICVGYPNELLDDVAVNNYYNKLNINFTTYLNAIMSINAFEFNRNLKRLRQPVKNCYWIDTSEKTTMVNAEYNFVNNGFQLPAAFFQDAVFDKYRPNYINYATAGMIVGHEMTHGFDNMGKNYDADGNYKKWWSNDTLRAFEEKVQCIIDQYEQYLVPQINMTVNGTLTLPENIADNGGLKYSFLAYTNWVKQNGPENMLPGLNFTTNQMFWIAFAQFLCSHNSLNLQNLQLLDVHAPSMFRVIGTLSNIKHFSTDFKCPLGSPMNPPKKCSVW